MSGERLAAHLEAAGLMARAREAGGFATVLQKGDAERGSIVLMIAEKGRHYGCLERMLSPSGRYEWTRSGPDGEAELAEIQDFVAKKRRFDPDLWLIELDIADAERFVAETTEFS
ncbi:DUF1491 family protein [Sphingomicrobium lutaoense]|uniref:DUF1491 family protein n=1 Tax=Sphingomicrobium lutaoense TaxID=515949 RepID=A0A839Z7H9_9SPHN|nr:DUF1491 family protein [Sphingomicrobium lutaoense]MBB3764804.1 hypothetical protein [Sphingomicrobium lutaoense]